MTNPNFPTQAREIFADEFSFAETGYGDALAALTRLHYQELEAVLEGVKKKVAPHINFDERTNNHWLHESAFNYLIDQALAEVRREMEAK